MKVVQKVIVSEEEFTIFAKCCDLLYEIERKSSIDSDVFDIFDDFINNFVEVED